ncbi:BID domain-containing T4SS effector [Bartonella quintana]|nr:BID domain-containing T4SS effector [Bartonella quintana]
MQGGEALYARAAPQRPPRAKDKEKNTAPIQGGEALYARAAPQRPPRAKDKEKNTAPIQGGEALYARAAPQRPPRAKDKEKNTAPIQGGEALYAMAAPQRPPRAKDKEKNTAPIQGGEALYAMAAPQKKKTILSKDEISKRLQGSVSIQYCEAEIQHWCRVVYGNPHALKEEIATIKENPMFGEQLSWEVANHPTSFSKLAGNKMLGIKNSARKEAEAGLPSLCNAIGDYAKTVKREKESILQNYHAEQKRHEQPMERVQMVKKPRKPLHLEKEMAPLSNKEIAYKIQRDISVQYGQAEIQYWCHIVYDNPCLLRERTEEIQKNPAMGEELSWQVANHPTFFAKFAGHQTLGIKNEARKKAEAGLSSLCNALDSYTNAVKQAKESIIKEHQEKQNRQGQSAGLAQELQKKQHALSKWPKLPEHSTVTARHESGETSRQVDSKPPDVRPRKVGTTKAMAFTH